MGSRRLEIRGGVRGSETQSGGGCRYVYTVVYAMPKMPE